MTLPKLKGLTEQEALYLIDNINGILINGNTNQQFLNEIEEIPNDERYFKRHPSSKRWKVNHTDLVSKLKRMPEDEVYSIQKGIIKVYNRSLKDAHYPSLISSKGFGRLKHRWNLQRKTLR
jgi:hypothetical protein